jgi:hypothetical protein
MRRAARLLLLTTLLAAGCAEKDHVVIELSASGFNPVQELDSVWVTVTASRLGDTLCEPFTEVVSLVPGFTGSVTLPATVEVEAGSVYDQVLFVRVEGKRGGVLHLRDERMASLAGGDVRLDVVMTGSCLDVGLDEGELCQDGVVSESPYWRIFDEGEGVQAGESCRP